MRTHIGYGAPTKQDTSAAHGSALGEEEIAKWKELFGWPAESFYVPDEALAHMRESTAARGASLENEWNKRFTEWAKAEPSLAAEWQRRMTRQLPDGWASKVPPIEGEKLATRKAQVKVLATIADAVPEVVGGSADLTESNGTAFGKVDPFAVHMPGRYVHYGIREHGMAAAMNGMVLHGGLRPFGGTFLIFSDYHRPSVRLAALMEIPTIFVYSHDSIGLGEDGPTHQPIEQLTSLRTIHNMCVIRPCDANETAAAWIAALERIYGPSAIVVTRQDLPIYDRSENGGYAPASGLAKGAYVLRETGPDKAQPDIVLIGSGSEVQLADGAADLLAADGVRARIVSMPSWELFEEQPQSYRDSVLPPDVNARVTVEAGGTHGWERYAGPAGVMIGIDRFGASAPGSKVMTELGFTVDNVASKARSLL
jgi:transketolase